MSLRNRLAHSNIRTALLAAGLAVLVSTLIASCGGGTSGDAKVMAVRTGEGDKTRKPTETERAELRIQMEVVKNYWALPYISEYDLFSSSFKQLLKERHGVSNADEYNSVMSTNEREWVKETYEKAELMNTTLGRITALVEWKEAGYSGIETVIFDLTKEEGLWKISAIFY